MSDNLELTAAITTEEPEVAATLDELRYLVFQGMKGDTGDSAYEEAVQLGFEGTEEEWLESLKGEQGEPGKAKSAYLDYDVVRLVEDDSIYTSLLMRTDIDNGILPFVLRGIESNSVEEYFELDQQAISAASPVVHFRSRAHLLAVDSTGHFTLTDRPQGGGDTDAVLYTPQTLTPAQQEQARENIGAGTYTKPSGGIPASDLASAVRDSLGKADTALQTAPVTSVNGMTGAVTVKTPYYLTVTDNGGTITVDKTPAEIDALSVDGYDVHMRLPMTVGEYTAVGDMRYFVTIGISAFYGLVWFGNAPLIATARVTEQKIVNYELTFVVTEGDIIRIENALTDKADKSDIPSLTGYATETWVEDKDYQTAQQVQTAIAGVRQLPTVTASDNGKFLRVVSGAWAAETVQTYQGGSY